MNAAARTARVAACGAVSLLALLVWRCLLSCAAACSAGVAACPAVPPAPRLALPVWLLAEMCGCLLSLIAARWAMNAAARTARVAACGAVFDPTYGVPTPVQPIACSNSSCCSASTDFPGAC
jgi:hypothetical protein